jgi:hypothetical protein
MNLIAIKIMILSKTYTFITALLLFASVLYKEKKIEQIKSQCERVTLALSKMQAIQKHEN